MTNTWLMVRHLIKLQLFYYFGKRNATSWSCWGTKGTLEIPWSITSKADIEVRFSRIWFLKNSLEAFFRVLFQRINLFFVLEFMLASGMVTKILVVFVTLFFFDLALPWFCRPRIEINPPDYDFHLYHSDPIKVRFLWLAQRIRKPRLCLVVKVGLPLKISNRIFMSQKSSVETFIGGNAQGARMHIFSYF